FTGKTGVPLTCFVNDPHGLDRAFKRSVPTDSDAPNAVQLQTPSVYLRTHAVLFELETVEAVASLEARVACLFARFHSAKKGLIGKVNLLDNTLRRLAEHLLSIRERRA